MVDVCQVNILRLSQLKNQTKKPLCEPQNLLTLKLTGLGKLDKCLQNKHETLWQLMIETLINRSVEGAHCFIIIMFVPFSRCPPSLIS